MYLLANVLSDEKEKKLNESNYFFNFMKCVYRGILGLTWCTLCTVGKFDSHYYD